MANKTLKVALTGGIASGKTLVSDLLGIHGCHIVDLDVIAREVVLPGTEGLKELLEVFAEYNEGSIPAETVYTNVSPTFKKNVQVGWVYTRLSEDRQQAVTIWLEKGNEAQVVSVQNGIVDVYNFMDDKWTTSGTGRPQGNITVMQETGSK